mmetsp:Transcript_22098/g.23674  ORF Transcript_22098/g.23674 Transcript_22098/m.23674 type:complete len:614 (-) Transcript_22098:845-2686(-)
MRVIRRQKERNNNKNNTKKGLLEDLSHQKRSSASINNVNLNSCLKKQAYDSDGSIFMRKSKESGDSDACCLSRSKKVRFDVVEIRNYERTVSDNPCCSSGPPIGIGWNHEDSNKFNINDYEQNQGDRLTHLDMVLSRKERENLLIEWGIPNPIIAQSIRAASKAKNQRKQTVVNRRKVFRLEKAIEVASRKLKRVLLLPRKRTDAFVEELSEQIVPNAIEKDHRAKDTISYSRSLDEDKTIQIHVAEPDDDIIGKVDMNITLSNVASFTPVETEVPTDGGIYISEEDDDDDKNIKDDNISINDDFTLGATTLGNNSAYTTPSLIEMENFYRELELELFGDETELPSMVGQTLEVPVKYDDIVDEVDTRSYNDTSRVGTVESNPQSASFEKYLVGPVSADESRKCSHLPMYYTITQQHESNYDVPTTSTRTRTYHHNHINEDYYCHMFANQEMALSAPPFSQALYESTHSLISNPDRRSHHTTFESGTNHLTTSQNRSIPYSRGSYEPMHTPMNDNYNYRRRNGSFDSGSQIITENQFVHSPNESGMQYHSQCEPSCKTGVDDLQYECHSQSQNTYFDGPQIRHIPLHRNQWMEDNNEERFYNNAIATITKGNH